MCEIFTIDGTLRGYDGSADKREYMDTLARKLGYANYSDWYDNDDESPLYEDD